MTAAAVEYAQIRLELMDFGNTDFQIDAILRLIRVNGRSYEWLRAWMETARRNADNPGAYIWRMVQANMEVAPAKPCTSRKHSDDDPYSRAVPPERAAAIDARADAEYQRTRRQVRDITDGRPITPEERELLHRTMAQLKAKMAFDAPVVKPRPKAISEEEKETLAQVRAELRCRRVGE